MLLYSFLIAATYKTGEDTLRYLSFSSRTFTRLIGAHQDELGRMDTEEQHIC
jgi:hypothetical protein